MAASLSVGIPGPWSEIWATAQPSSRHHRTSTWPPRGENLIAFASRLTNTCSTRSRTPSTPCGSAGGRGVSITPCSPANAATVSSPAATLSSSDTGSSWNSMRPASRRERSSRSFTNRISRSANDLLDLRSEEHTSELQSRLHLVCRLLLEKKKTCNDQYILCC